MKAILGLHKGYQKLQPWGWSPLSRKAWSLHEAASSAASFPDAWARQEPSEHSPTSPTCQTKTLRMLNKPRCSENTEHATYLPDLTAVLMSLSALLKPSAEPVNGGQAQSFNYNFLTNFRCFTLFLLYQSRWRWFVCSPQQQDLWPGHWHHNLVQNTSALECWASPAAKRMSPTGSHRRLQILPEGKVLLKHFYLILHNIGQVQRLLNDAHEGLSQHLCNKNVRHREQTVWPEGLDQQQLVHCLANGSWRHKSKAFINWDRRIIIYMTLQTHGLTRLLLFWPQIRYSQFWSVALNPHEELLEKQKMGTDTWDCSKQVVNLFIYYNRSNEQLSSPHQPELCSPSRWMLANDWVGPWPHSAHCSDLSLWAGMSQSGQSLYLAGSAGTLSHTTAHWED